MNINNLVAKLKELAERGERGERDLARKKLDELLSKYEVGLVDATSEDAEATLHWIRWQYPWETTLIYQTAYMLFGDLEAWEHKRHNRTLKEIGYKITDTQFMELEYLYRFYRELFVQDMDTFMSAFIQKHRLFNRSSTARDTLSPEEYEKLANMMAGMTSKSPHKALETREEEED